MASENEWVYDLDTTIFSIVKSKEFPTIYIHSLQGIEKGMDLERTRINAIQETVQVDISTNTNQSDAKYVMKITTDIFKEMMFYVVAMPELTSDGETYKCTARFRRVISSNDTLL